MAWHSMAMRACSTSSRMLGSGARHSVSAWPSTEASAARTKRAAAVLDVEQAQHGERAQRLAQHRPADAQRQRQLALGQQAVACLQLARQQPVAKEGENPRRAASAPRRCSSRMISSIAIGQSVV